MIEWFSTGAICICINAVCLEMGFESFVRGIIIESYMRQKYPMLNISHKRSHIINVVIMGFNFAALIFNTYLWMGWIP
jgi:hypothetical protein